MCSIPLRKCFYLLLFLLLDKPGHVCWYSGVKSLCVCVDLGSLRAETGGKLQPVSKNRTPVFILMLLLQVGVFSLFLPCSTLHSQTLFGGLCI